uniref:Uncharacterized protein n=1 Tax=Anguilla anguilla TaxID=7936 RepID=A0A0E9UUJ4_ANGAN
MEFARWTERKRGKDFY